MGPAIKITPNLILRVEDESKSNEVLNLYLNNRQFEEYEPTRPVEFYTEDYQRRALHREYMAYMFGTFLRYYIYLRSDTTNIIGSINFNLYFGDYEPYSEIGYKIDALHQNRGYAYEACEAAMQILSKDYDIHRIDARIHPDNAPSLCLARKLGFRYLTLEPQSANIMGQYTDLLRYTLRI